MIAPILGESFVRSASLDNGRNGLASIGGANINTSAELGNSISAISEKMRQTPEHMQKNLDAIGQNLLGTQAYETVYEYGPDGKVKSSKQIPIADSYQADGLLGKHQQRTANQKTAENRVKLLGEQSKKAEEAMNTALDNFNAFNSAKRAVANSAEKRATEELKSIFGDNVGNFSDVKQGVNKFVWNIARTDIDGFMQDIATSGNLSGSYNALVKATGSNAKADEYVAIIRQVYNAGQDERNASAGILSDENLKRHAYEVKNSLLGEGYNEGQANYLTDVAVKLGTQGILEQQANLASIGSAARHQHNLLSLEAAEAQKRMDLANKVANAQIGALNAQAKAAKSNGVDMSQFGSGYGDGESNVDGTIFDIDLKGENWNKYVEDPTKYGLNRNNMLFINHNGKKWGVRLSDIDRTTGKVKDNAYIYDATNFITKAQANATYSNNVNRIDEIDKQLNNKSLNNGVRNMLKEEKIKLIDENREIMNIMEGTKNNDSSDAENIKLGINPFKHIISASIYGGKKLVNKVGGGILESMQENELIPYNTRITSKSDAMRPETNLKNVYNNGTTNMTKLGLGQLNNAKVYTKEMLLGDKSNNIKQSNTTQSSSTDSIKGIVVNPNDIKGIDKSVRESKKFQTLQGINIGTEMNTYDKALTKIEQIADIKTNNTNPDNLAGLLSKIIPNTTRKQWLDMWSKERNKEDIINNVGPLFKEGEVARRLERGTNDEKSAVKGINALVIAGYDFNQSDMLINEDNKQDKKNALQIFDTFFKGSALSNVTNKNDSSERQKAISKELDYLLKYKDRNGNNVFAYVTNKNNQTIHPEVLKALSEIYGITKETLEDIMRKKGIIK